MGPRGPGTNHPHPIQAISVVGSMVGGSAEDGVIRSLARIWEDACQLASWVMVSGVVESGLIEHGVVVQEAIVKTTGEVRINTVHIINVRIHVFGHMVGHGFGLNQLGFNHSTGDL